MGVPNLKPIGCESQTREPLFWRERSSEQHLGDVDCSFTDGDILTPQQIRDRAHQLWNDSGDSQETLAAQIDRSQAAVHKALRRTDESETRYVKTCVDVIEHYCDGITIRYPRGQVDISS